MEIDDLPFAVLQDEAFFNKMDEDLDFAFALSFQEQMNEDATQETLKSVVPPIQASKGPSKSLSIVDDQWELIDPHPDIHGLFLEFNRQFFYGKLLGIEVKWSPRMTLCAGVCSYEGRGGMCSVRLSLPLLKLRPRRDLVETLLHEMIHAYLFVTANNKDRNGHGPEFLSHMYRINKETGTKITVYHSFHDEVDLYRKHWWKCNGPCQKRQPFFGIVKRAMNRAPAPRDNWWDKHQASCGGTFIKIKEPEDKKKQNAVKRKPKDQKSSVDIRKYLEPSPSKTQLGNLSKTTKKSKINENIHNVKSIFTQEDNLVEKHGADSSSSAIPVLKERNSPTPFSGSGVKLGSGSSVTPKSLLSKIRRDLGYLNSRNNHQRSSEVVEIFNKNEEIPSSSLSMAGTSKPFGVLKDTEYKSGMKMNSLQSPLVDLESKLSTARKEMHKQELDPIEELSHLNKVLCPVCASLVLQKEVNAHLDRCLLMAS